MSAIIASEILFKYSAPGASAGDATAGTANGSLGKFMSSTAWAGGSVNDLFDNISGAENAASTVDYRCIYIHNSNAANSLQNAVVYLSAEVAGGASIAIAIDNTAASAHNSGTQQGAVIATETTTPSGVGSFSSPTTAGTGLSLGTLAVGQCRAVWVRRTAANSAALSADGVTIAVQGDTGSL